MEQWWETTDTFHTILEDWSLISFEFAVVSRIHFDHHPLEFYEDWTTLGVERFTHLLSFAFKADVGGVYQRSVLLRQLVVALQGAIAGTVIVIQLAQACAL
ncbi:hypothetical protein JCGZ_25157 [Jatropha curcas]|uniref:Aminotransferase-like plant mobile domain-containing protein n=1 Tax=Jatropha curcas TaxID=180498 RepID=A0A067JY06_JATCU|nr:hypothetical protein JCGZ_25157 [Jatropha curcas]